MKKLLIIPILLISFSSFDVLGAGVSGRSSSSHRSGIQGNLSGPYITVTDTDGSYQRIYTSHILSITYQSGLFGNEITSISIVHTNGSDVIIFKDLVSPLTWEHILKVLK